MNNTKGFTLIEVLMVIAIVGILASVVVASLSGSRAQGRDSKRVTDIERIALALDLYHSHCRQYPAPTGTALDLTAHNGSCTGVTLQDFLPGPVPVDPKGGAYVYATNGAGNSHSTYVLKAVLETNDPALIDDLDGANVLGQDCGATPEVAGAYYYCKGS
jgi:general secretion pathway protein G